MLFLILVLCFYCYSVFIHVTPPLAPPNSCVLRDYTQKQYLSAFYSTNTHDSRSRRNEDRKEANLSITKHTFIFISIS
jgi:hypothetical protein